MFNHCYCPVDLSKEFNRQIDMFQHQAQMVVDGQVFLDLSNKIIKAQVAGKYFELIILLPKGYRTLENANLIHRIANAGAKVGVLEVSTFDSEIEQFAIFDSKLLYSNRLVEHVKDLTHFFLKKHHDFESIMNTCRQVSSFSDAPIINFSANKYFVSKGEELKLSWNVQNSSSVVLNPGNRRVEPLGEETLFIEDDCLFTITSKNVKSKTSLSIFIKYLQEEDLKLSVSVFNKETDDYIKIDSTTTNESIYAVYFNDLVRVEWICNSRSKLIEAKMGDLKNIGFQNLIVGENIDLNFELHTAQGVFNRKLTIYPLQKRNSIKPLELTNVQLNVSNESAPMYKGFIHAWITKVQAFLKSKS